MSRVWFITGTSSGLGKATVEAVLLKGERVVATLRKPEVLAYLRDKYPASQLFIAEVDVTKDTQIKAAFALALKVFGRIDVVVNNAGYAIFGEIEGTPEVDARYEFEVQFWGPVAIMKEAARVFREINPAGDGGRIFNVSSAGGYAANPTISYYNASKFALEGMTQAFLKEMQPSWNITGCIIEPGGFDSEWKGSSAHVLPPHPAYSDPSNPCAQYRSYHDTFPVLGSAKRMASALIKLADEPTLPLRIQFGSESNFLVRSQAKLTATDAEKWKDVADSTNSGAIDGDVYIRDFLLASGNFDNMKGLE